MRKQLLAFFSALGLAGSSAPALAQAPKGSPPVDSKTESTIKNSKTVQEDAASKDLAKKSKSAMERKRSLSSVEGGHATSDVVLEKAGKSAIEGTAQDADKKVRKVPAELSASQSAMRDKRKKVASENGAVSTELSRKHRTQMVDGSVSKGIKTNGESNAVRNETTVKGSKAAADANSVQNEAAKKASQAQPK